MTSAPGCTAPKRGHKTGSDEQQKCPVHGVTRGGAAAIPGVVSSPPAAPSARIEARQTFDSPLPGVLGDLEDWGLVIDGDDDDSEIVAYRRLVSRIGDDRWLVLERRYSSIEVEIEDDDEVEDWDDVDLVVRLVHDREWILCENPSDPHGTAIEEEADDLWVDDELHDNYKEANREVRHAVTAPWSDDDFSCIITPSKRAQRLTREARFAKNLEATGISRNNDAAIDYLAGIGIDLREAEDVDLDAAWAAKKMKPNPTT